MAIINPVILMEQSVSGSEFSPRSSARWHQRWWGRGLVAIVLAILLFFGYVGYLVLKKLPQAGNYVNRFTASGPFSSAPVDFNILYREGDPEFGPSGAALTIVEFGDFECPYCREAYPTVRLLMAEFGDRVRFVYRHFPVPELHDQAIAAAEASMCANEQGKFWPYHDRLFQSQPRFAAADLKQYALQVGLNAEKFNNCFDSRQYKIIVERDMADGKKLGVRGTPTWFINGRKEEGAIPEDKFRERIVEELNKP